VHLPDGALPDRQGADDPARAPFGAWCRDWGCTWPWRRICVLGPRWS